MNGAGRRHVANLRRRRPQREPYSRVLIVTEGQKTEAAYFTGVAKHYRLSTANVVILGHKGAA